MFPAFNSSPERSRTEALATLVDDDSDDEGVEYGIGDEDEHRPSDDVPIISEQQQRLEQDGLGSATTTEPHTTTETLEGNNSPRASLRWMSPLGLRSYTASGMQDSVESVDLSRSLSPQSSTLGSPMGTPRLSGAANMQDMTAEVSRLLLSSTVAEVHTATASFVIGGDSSKE